MSENNLPNTEPKSYPVPGDHLPAVNGWLEEGHKVPRKQRHTVWRIYCQPRAGCGIRGSYSPVKK